MSLYKLSFVQFHICTSGKDVDILDTHTLKSGSGTFGPIALFNPPKSGLQSRALCDTECALWIANITLLNWPIVSLLILFYFILFSKLFCNVMHDYTLYFTGCPVCSVRYYSCISLWTYYIVVHYTHVYRYIWLFNHS